MSLRLNKLIYLPWIPPYTPNCPWSVCVVLVFATTVLDNRNEVENLDERRHNLKNSGRRVQSFLQLSSMFAYPKWSIVKVLYYIKGSFRWSFRVKSGKDWVKDSDPPTRGDSKVRTRTSVETLLPYKCGDITPHYCPRREEVVDPTTGSTSFQTKSSGLLLITPSVVHSLQTF